MCARYSLKIEASKLRLKYNIQFSEKVEFLNFDLLPYSLAPVVVLKNGERKLTPMKFSLVPSWSDEPKVKFATHNARLESVTEKPTWKIPFQSQHCVVPMTSFGESVYEGPLAGNLITFKEKNNDLLFAAGIFDYWEDIVEPQNSFFSFAILTREPSTFILDHGHDRTPIFLKEETAFEWLNLINKDVGFIKSELLKLAYHPELKVEVDRPLKAGWENRK
ncbi:MAG: SOS response-associated peptidase [Pseudobdellovibrio sp.]